MDSIKLSEEHDVRAHSSLRLSRRSRKRMAATASVICMGVMLSSCVQTTRTNRSIAMEEPVASHGVFIDETDPNRLKELAEALDAMRIGGVSDDEATREGVNQPRFDESTVDAALPREAHVPRTGTMTTIPQPPDGFPRALRLAMKADVVLPDDAVRIHALPKLSDIEIHELIDYIALQLAADLNYAAAQSRDELTLPEIPDGVSIARVLTRQTDEHLRAICFGYRRFISQPPQLWVLGIGFEADGAVVTNQDVDVVGDLVAAAIESMNEMRGSITVQDLESKLVQLSYTDVPTAITLLKAMGFTAYAQATDMPQALEYGNLPYIVAIPDPEGNAIGLVGGTGTTGGRFGLSLTPNVASELPGETIASPMTQLLVLYHPAEPEQFSRVRRLLNERIDRPARQIFVEALVLEISEEGLNELGIEWELDGASLVLTGGVLTAGGTSPTAGIVFDDFLNPEFRWTGSVELRALIREGKAEVLSRPSVLTLNNRQATIRVGTDIPISTSQEGLSGLTSKISFDFSYLATGILLNIRPRINESGSEVSMLIDTIVSDTVRGADLEIRSNDGDLLASAPTVSTRRVQTYARIRNNTPFIIGGLVSKESTSVTDRIPLLSELPLLGNLFKTERSSSERREVIIVLTPYVLPEVEDRLARSLPKDEDAFDSFGNELFRDSYRIRTDDVFDLEFLIENPRLRVYRDVARRAIARNFTLAEQRPFSWFADERIPGESTLVVRMMYEVVKRLNLDENVQIPQIIYFEDRKVGGYEVRFLEQTMESIAREPTFTSFFRELEGHALAITFQTKGAQAAPGRLANEPIPIVQMLACPDRDRWSQLLWEMNQPAADGSLQHTILIHDESDLVRLRRAIALKRVVALNGGEEGLRLRNFSVGRKLLMPDLRAHQVHVADAKVAQLFFATELYYPEVISSLEAALSQLDRIVRDPAFPMPDLRRQLEASGVNNTINPGQSDTD